MQITKGKHYPLAVMLDAISIYNLGYSLEETCRITNQRMTTKKSAFADSGEPTQSRVGSGLSPEMESNTKNNSCQEGVEVAEFASAGSWVTIQTPYSSTPTPQSSYTMQIQPSTLSNWLSEFKLSHEYMYMTVLANTPECANMRHSRIRRVFTNERECANNLRISDLFVRANMQLVNYENN